MLGAPQWLNLTTPECFGAGIRSVFGQPKKFMKPTQLDAPLVAGGSMPLTDWNYQTTLQTPRTTTSGKVSGTTNLRPLWKLSADYGAESSRSFVRELLAILGLSALAAWPVIFSIYSIVRMVRNY